MVCELYVDEEKLHSIAESNQKRGSFEIVLSEYYKSKGDHHLPPRVGHVQDTLYYITDS